MSKKIEIGAPSITGIDYNDTVNELFTDAKFPLNVRLLNHLPRSISLPEAGVFLKPLTGKSEAKIANFDELHRLVSSIEQIAELNKHELAITLVDLSGDAAIDPPATEPPKEPLKTAKTTTASTTTDPVTPAATVGG
jgi:hypothetical protein